MRRWTYEDSRIARVGYLIATETPVDYVCSLCSAFGHADLEAIRRARGDDFPMMDFLALCRKPDCHGLLRFQTARGVRRDWLLSPKGQARLDAHSDLVRAWASHLTRKRTQQVRLRAKVQSKRPKAPCED